MTEYEGFVCAPGDDVGKIAIIVSKFNKTITENLLDGALQKLRQHLIKEEQIDVIRVPGAFELPTVAERLACDDQYAAIICLGCVIKGETPHDEYINAAVSQQLARIGAEYCLPVVFGLLTCYTVEQALARSGSVTVGKDKVLGEQPGNKGVEAAEVALEMIDLFGKLPELDYEHEVDATDYPSIGKNAQLYRDGDFEDVDVYPDELVDLPDDEEDEDAEPWFLHGKHPVGSKQDRGARREKSERQGGPEKKRDGDRHGKGDFFRNGKHKPSNKSYSKDGDKRKKR